MVINIDELVSRIDQALFSSEDLHPHPELIKRAQKGPEWYQDPESGDRTSSIILCGEMDEYAACGQSIFPPSKRLLIGCTGK